MAKPILTLEQLKEILFYDPEDGSFTWRHRHNCYRAKAGEKAGSTTLNTEGRRDRYFRIGIYGRKYLAHRLAWFYMTGHWPERQIDHIDGNRANNRFDNLRQATNQQNCQNMRKPRQNTVSGFLGVTPRNNKWEAAIMAGGPRIYLGVFNTQKEAHEAYVAAKRKLHPFGTL